MAVSTLGRNLGREPVEQCCKVRPWGRLGLMGVATLMPGVANWRPVAGMGASDRSPS
jgi:hypothetical protein